MLTDEENTWWLLLAPSANPKTLSSQRNVYSLFPFYLDLLRPRSLLTDDGVLKVKDWDPKLSSLRSNWSSARVESFRRKVYKVIY
ncbi:hypothetical protein AVEN_206613-1 [Araneus ventricosus]|uniref:Uncharacterized protein n=1 Tax=Araneus ventricosus TaxID=182803 RepID=A0A4Y2SL40_ARAVE|nr:hypothetical protein AVEN_206613-1 [Araneus ventricosus]